MNVAMSRPGPSRALRTTPRALRAGLLLAFALGISLCHTATPGRAAPLRAAGARGAAASRARAASRLMAKQSAKQSASAAKEARDADEDNVLAFGNLGAFSADEEEASQLPSRVRAPRAAAAARGARARFESKSKIKIKNQNWFGPRGIRSARARSAPRALCVRRPLGIPPRLPSSHPL
jgi:hypothetical protein